MRRGAQGDFPTTPPSSSEPGAENSSIMQIADTCYFNPPLGRRETRKTFKLSKLEISFSA